MSNITAISTLPLTWEGLQLHCRRLWLENHRGETPRKRPDIAARDVPLPVAICMHLSAPQSFRTEAEAETYRRVASRAHNAVSYWQFASEAREQARLILDGVHYWLGHRRDDKGRWRRSNYHGGKPFDVRNATQAELDTAEFRQRWAAYRKLMWRQFDQTDWVRVALTPRTAPVVTVPAIAAE